MDDIMISACTLKKVKESEHNYLREVNLYGNATTETKFTYAWCLIDVGGKSNLSVGIRLLNDLYYNGVDVSRRRDYQYYLAIGYTKQKDYTRSLEFINFMLENEPTNRQLITLKKHVEKKLKDDGVKGMIMVGTGALILGGAIGIAMKLINR